MRTEGSILLASINVNTSCGYLLQDQHTTCVQALPSTYCMCIIIFIIIIIIIIIIIAVVM